MRGTAFETAIKDFMKELGEEKEKVGTGHFSKRVLGTEL